MELFGPTKPGNESSLKCAFKRCYLSHIYTTQIIDFFFLSAVTFSSLSIPYPRLCWNLLNALIFCSLSLNQCYFQRVTSYKSSRAWMLGPWNPSSVLTISASEQNPSVYLKYWINRLEECKHVLSTTVRGDLFTSLAKQHAGMFCGGYNFATFACASVNFCVHFWFFIFFLLLSAVACAWCNTWPSLRRSLVLFVQ